MARAALRPPVLLTAAALSAAAPASAQEVEFRRPAEWRVRADTPDGDVAEDLYFVEMPPGWHVTTGPGVALWHPATTAGGTFRVEMEVFLFDPEQRRQGFGFFVGGRDLEGPGRTWVGFLVREGGEYRVTARRGARTEALRGWDAHPSVMSYTDRPAEESTARNVLVMEAREDAVRFVVNEREVLSVARRELPPLDGIVGLRVDPGLNLHVSRLDVVTGR